MLTPSVPCFIPDSHEFMWQDDKDIIYMQNVDGQVIKRFEHPFTVQNHRMTADKSFYLSADMWNHLYKGYENDITPIYTDGASISKPVDFIHCRRLFFYLLPLPVPTLILLLQKRN